MPQCRREAGVCYARLPWHIYRGLPCAANYLPKRRNERAAATEAFARCLRKVWRRPRPRNYAGVRLTSFATPTQDRNARPTPRVQVLSILISHALDYPARFRLPGSYQHNPAFGVRKLKNKKNIREINRRGRRTSTTTSLLRRTRRSAGLSSPHAIPASADLTSPA